MAQVFEIGWLDGLDSPVNFHGGQIEAVHSSPDERSGAMEGRLHADGWIYPPQTQRWRLDDDDSPLTPAENTGGPTRQFRLPATHRLRWDGALTDIDRRAEAFLFLKVLGILRGTSLNFSDWWNFHRVQHRTDWCFHAAPRELEAFLSKIVVGIYALPEAMRLDAVGALTLAENGRACHQSWEAFVWQWTAAERIGAFACDVLAGDPSRSVPKRTPYLQDIVRRFGKQGLMWRLPNCGGAKASRPKWPGRLASGAKTAQELGNADEDLDDLMALRNDLIHRGLWGPDALIYGGSGAVVVAAEAMRRLVQRLILVLLGIDCEFRRTPWICPQYGATYALGLGDDSWRRPVGAVHGD